MKNKVTKSSLIKIKVGLNADNLPVKMEWESDDHASKPKPQECKAMLLSLFDKASKDTLKIDLWTSEMQIGEMDRFFFQTLRAMGDTYFKATQNKELAVEMQKFVHYFGEKTGIVSKDS